MDDITSKLTELLGDPNMMEQIKGLTGLFGGGAKEEPAPPTASPLGDIALNGDTIQTIMKILPLFNSLKEEDDNTRLLQALRPFLGEERKKKLDEATKMLSMMKMLPMLKSVGGIF